MDSFGSHMINPFEEPSVLEQIQKAGATFKVFPQIFQEKNQLLTATSICDYGGQILVAQRLLSMKSGSVTENWRQNSSCIIISELELDGLNLVPRKLVKWARKAENISLEDPRIFVYQGKLQIWAMAGKFVPPPTSIRQVILTMNSDFEIIDYRFPAFGRNGGLGYEKNWCPIIGTGMFVYKTNHEHVVIDLDSNIVHSSKGLSWQYGDFHGGTQVITVNNQYMMILHSSLEVPHVMMKQENLSARQYFVGAYTFEKTPPYRILQFTPEPIFSGSYQDMVLPGSPACIFVTGAMNSRRKDSVLLTMNINDCQSVIVDMPVSSILMKLKNF